MTNLACYIVMSILEQIHIIIRYKNHIYYHLYFLLVIMHCLILKRYTNIQKLKRMWREEFAYRDGDTNKDGQVGFTDRIYEHPPPPFFQLNTLVRYECPIILL